MPSFVGAAHDAAASGQCVRACAHCGGWTWWPADAELTEATRAAGRAFCATKACETAERFARGTAVSP